MRIKYNKGIEGKNAWLDVNSLEDSPSLPLLLQLLQVQLVLPYSTGDQALLAMAAALYENNIMLLPTIEPGTVQVRYDATAAASLFTDAPSGEVGIVWIEASKLDSPQSLSLDTPEATYYPLRLQDDNMSFKGLPYRHYMDNSMEVSDKTVLYYCRCYFRASSTVEPLYDTVHSFSVQGLADNAYVYDRRYSADPFVLYPWLSDKFREEHGIGPIGYIAVEDTYTSRETADGADIIDGALATLKTVQGATVKTTNLLTFPYLDGASYTQHGVTVTANSDGSITINGTPTDYVYYKFISDFRGVGKFILSGIPSSANLSFTVTVYNSAGNSIGTVDGYRGETIQFNTADYEGYDHARLRICRVMNGVAINNVTVYPMLNTGDSALPYMPYFPGLKNAYFKGLQSTGRNLVDQSSLLVGHYTNSDFGIVNFPLFRSIKVYLSAGTYTLQSAVELQIVRTIIDGKYSIVGISGTTYTFITTAAGYVGISFRRGDNTDWVDGTNLMLNYGSTALPYEPYVSHEISLDTAIELPAWDSIDLARGKKIVQSNTITFDGTENWILTVPIAENVVSIAYHFDNKCGTGNDYVNSTIRVGIPSNSPNDNAGCSLTNANYSAILVWFRQSAYPNVTDLASAKAQLAAWNAAGNPLTICYQTATATTTPLNATENRYIAYNNGSETVIQGTTDNSEYGAENTLTQEYYNLEVNDDE